MKINRLAGLAAIALLVVGATGAGAALAFAQPALQAQTNAAAPARQAARPRQPAAQVNQLPAAHVNQPSAAKVIQPAAQAAKPLAEPTESQTLFEAGTLTETTTETETGTTTEPITDTVNGGPNDQSGNQVGDTGGGQADQTDPGPNDQSPKLNGSITVTQTAAADDQTETAESAALAGLAKITVEQAKAAALAANANTNVTTVTLEDENGTLIYSVVLSNGSDVKVDAGNGAILQTDTSADGIGTGAESAGTGQD